jgi:hypothetical protein
MAVKCGLLESRVVHISLLIAPLTIEPPAAPEVSDKAFRTRLLDTCGMRPSDYKIKRYFKRASFA